MKLAPFLANPLELLRSEVLVAEKDDAALSDEQCKVFKLLVVELLELG